MILPTLLFLLFASAAGTRVYSGVVRIPLFAGGLPSGDYRIEVQGAVLRFFSDERKRMEVQGVAMGQSLEGLVPLAGAQFLRSSEDPLPTGQERQFSKTGAPQYAEEKRDWKGVLRLYRKPGANEVWFVFNERGAAGTWTATLFRLAATGDE